MPRKSTGKRTRFEVFKRDGFACVYCGAQPPAIVLVVDHSTPVVDGGPSTIENLVTACEPCNQGKAGKSLGDRAVRPDADLLYLEAQQEAAELRRYHVALAEKESALTTLVEDFQAVWCECSGLDWHPAEHIIRQWLARYDPEIVEFAMRDVAPKVAGGFIKRNQWDRYVWAVCRNMAASDAPGAD